jgi:hypothetical protein
MSIDCIDDFSNLIKIASIPKARVSSIENEGVDIHISELRINT